jgi:CDP-diacylglycerol--serine O-phosphatidyltransferase
LRRGHNLKEVIKHIPNILTLCNLTCGCVGIVYAFQGDIQTGGIMIWIGALFDFFDGFAARMLKQFSTIGKDLDSLADLITFCFLPGTIIYVIINQNSSNPFIPFLGYLLVIFGALRLAKFNNDTRQADTFYGLPVPASAIFVSAFPFVVSGTFQTFHSVLSNPYIMVGVAVLLSILMVSDIRLMSLKFKDFSFKANWQRFLLLLIAIVLILLFKIMALPLVILLYVVFSLALNISE